MNHTQDQLNDHWDNLKNLKSGLEASHTETKKISAPKIVRDGEFTQVISLPSEGGTTLDTYGRAIDGPWFPIHYILPESMTSEQRRKEIQRLADAHQDVVRCQVNFGRRYPVNRELPLAAQTELKLLIDAEARARAEFDAARVDWSEPIFVTPISH